MIALVDVHYDDAAGTARAACVIAASWSDAVAVEERVAIVAQVAPYRPGHFYQRELPCIAAILGAVSSPVTTVVVDGYVVLDGAGTPGLGMHLHQHLDGRAAVVGVAKRAFRGGAFAEQVVRGTSARPLYVTAIGVEPAAAAAEVRSMHGLHRIPTLLGRVDDLARGLISPA